MIHSKKNVASSGSRNSLTLRTRAVPRASVAKSHQAITRKYRLGEPDEPSMDPTQLRAELIDGRVQLNRASLEMLCHNVPSAFRKMLIDDLLDLHQASKPKRRQEISVEKILQAIDDATEEVDGNSGPVLTADTVFQELCLKESSSTATMQKLTRAVPQDFRAEFTADLSDIVEEMRGNKVDGRAIAETVAQAIHDTTHD